MTTKEACEPARDGIAEIIARLENAIAESEQDAERSKFHFGYFRTSDEDFE